MNRWKIVVTRSSQAANLIANQSSQKPSSRPLSSSSSSGGGQGRGRGQATDKWWRTAGAVTAASAAALAISMAEERKRFGGNLDLPLGHCHNLASNFMPKKRLLKLSPSLRSRYPSTTESDSLEHLTRSSTTFHPSSSSTNSVDRYIRRDQKKLIRLEFGSVRSSRSHNVCLSVCHFGDKFSRALNLHLSDSLSAISITAVSC